MSHPIKISHLLSCGQSTDLGHIDHWPPRHYQCPYCDAPAERALPRDRPIEPAVIDGVPVVYRALEKQTVGPRHQP